MLDGCGEIHRNTKLQKQNAFFREGEWNEMRNASKSGWQKVVVCYPDLVNENSCLTQRGRIDPLCSPNRKYLFYLEQVRAMGGRRIKTVERFFCVRKDISSDFFVCDTSEGVQREAIFKVLLGGKAAWVPSLFDR